MTTTTAKKPAEKASEVEFTFDGLRAITTSKDKDGVVTSVARDATFDEQISVLAPLVLEQAIGIIHNAAGGTVTTKGNSITITLEAL